MDGLGPYMRSLETAGFSGAVAVETPGGDAFEDAFGLRDREDGSRVDPSTVFTLGSVTKQFTATAVLLLNEDGRLKLTDSLPDFFRDVPEDKRSITVHDLLTHTSGLPDVLGGDWDLTATRPWLIAHALSAKLVGAPGEAYRYSNLGYSMLAAIVEIVSSQGYETFLRQRLFVPAGMQHTGYVLPRFEPEQLVVGYDEGVRWGTVLERPMLPDGPSWNLRGNGGMHTTIGDMVRWHHALGDTAIVPASVFRKLTTRYVDEGDGDSFYGYGWSLNDGPDGKPFMGHDGGNGVFSADLRRSVDHHGFLLVFSSTPDFPAWVIADRVEGMLYGGTADFQALDAISLPAETLAQWAGTYLLPGGDTLAVSVDGETLRVHAAGCVASYLMAGGVDVPDGARGLAARSVDAMAAAVHGDLHPFEALFRAGAPDRSIEVQHRYNRIQDDSGYGAFVAADLYRCMPDGDQVKVVVRLKYAGGTWYRSVRWREGRLSGYGIHEFPPGGLESTVLVPEASGSFRSFALEQETTSWVRFSGPGTLTVQRADGAAVATAEKREGAIRPPTWLIRLLPARRVCLRPSHRAASGFGGSSPS
jgi:CubicO group peptidase (beta-lactamase class C family)